MRAPKRIQLRRTKGWHKPEGVIVVARPSRWGNPFRVGQTGLGFYGLVNGDAGSYGTGWVQADLMIDAPLTAEIAVILYRECLEARLRRWPSDHPEDVADRRRLEADLAQLAGHGLACWCPLDQPCHADVLLELANR